MLKNHTLLATAFRGTPRLTIFYTRSSSWLYCLLHLRRLLTCSLCTVGDRYASLIEFILVLLPLAVTTISGVRSLVPRRCFGGGALPQPVYNRRRNTQPFVRGIHVAICLHLRHHRLARWRQLSTILTGGGNSTDCHWGNESRVNVATLKKIESRWSTAGSGFICEGLTINHPAARTAS